MTTDTRVHLDECASLLYGDNGEQPGDMPCDCQREADRIAAFCLSGEGHTEIVFDPPEPDVGFRGARYCGLCGTDLPMP